jgi:hypothetical protein
LERAAIRKFDAGPFLSKNEEYSTEDSIQFFPIIINQRHFSVNSPERIDLFQRLFLIEIPEIEFVFALYNVSWKEIKNIYTALERTVPYDIVNKNVSRIKRGLLFITELESICNLGES